MKKLIAESPDKVVVADIDVPKIKPDQVLVKSVRSLISPGSELNRVRRLPGDADSKWPNHDLGYAVCGEVIEVGEDVTKFKVGDRVATMQHHQQFVASPVPTDPKALYVTLPIPAEISWDASPFVLWGRSCYNWLTKANISPGETVAVVGLGLVGLLMTMWAKLREPGSVIGIDLFDLRLDLAQKAGADEVIHAKELDPVDRVNALTAGRGADLTFHCVSTASVTAFETSQRITRRGGRIMLIGIHSEPLTILRGEFLSKDLLGAGTDYDMDYSLYTEGIEAIRTGKLPVIDIVTHNAPFTQGPELYEMLNFRPQESGAVLLKW
jgi:L-iditol 2-dehydrogenase